MNICLTLKVSKLKTILESATIDANHLLTNIQNDKQFGVVMNIKHRIVNYICIDINFKFMSISFYDKYDNQIMVDYIYDEKLITIKNYLCKRIKSIDTK